MDSIKERLREAFGSDSQETIGKNLNMTQGNVSKLLSGAQQPTVDTLLRIANVYDVSIDWHEDSNLYSLGATKLERLQPIIQCSLPLKIYLPVSHSLVI